MGSNAIRTGITSHATGSVPLAIAERVTQIEVGLGGEGAPLPIQLAQVQAVCQLHPVPRPVRIVIDVHRP